MIDPFTLSMIASGIQTGIGALQSASASKKRKSAISKLEELAANSPLYKPSKEIGDYYQEALNRYRQSPQQSQEYLLGKGNIQGAMSSGLQALQDRRSAIGGVSRLAATGTNALRNLSAQAESRKMQDLSRLGQASQLQAAQTAQAFDINKMTPYNRKLQLQQMAAEGYTRDKAAFDQSVQSGIGNLATGAMYKGMSQYPISNLDITPNYDTAPLNFGTATGMYGKNPLLGRYTAPKTFKV